MEKKPSIIDVALAAGVGVGTASRAINGAPHVSDAALEAVRLAAKRLGYLPRRPEHRPGPRRKTEHAARAPVVELAIVGRYGLKWFLDCAPVYSYVVDGIESAVGAQGWRLQVVQVPGWSALERPVGGQTPHGRIVLATDDPEDAPGPEAASVPTVWTMGTPRRFRGDLVQPDHLRIGSLAAEHLLERGHRRCAYLGTFPGSPGFLIGVRGDTFRWEIERAGGSVAMLLDARLTVMEQGLNIPHQETLARMIARLVRLRPRPTALFVQSDMFTPIVYRLLLEHGIEPQRDLAIVTCNREPPYLQSLLPAPMVIDLQAEAIGRQAVEQLRWRIEHPTAPVVRVLVQPRMADPDEPRSSGRDRRGARV
jgi:LacI family transcriptional regulator